MQTLYRICTEDTNRIGIETVMRNAGLDCTIFPARGLFRGEPENSLVVECATDDENAVNIAARTIKILNHQTSILVQSLPVASLLL